MKTRWRWWWASGALLISAAAVAVVVNDESPAAGAFFLLALLWIVASLWLALWRIWRWATYRVGVRLFVTYLLIGVLPLIFAAAFAAVGLYIMMGQYTSVRLGSELRRVRWELAHQCGTVLALAEDRGVDVAISLLDELADVGHEPLPRVFWQARFGGRTVRIGGGEDLPELEWPTGEARGLTARFGDRAFGAVSAASGDGDRVTALIPLDVTSARALSDAWWFDVAFLLERSGGGGGTKEADAGLEETEPQEVDAVHISTTHGGMTFDLGGSEVSAGEIWPPWPETDANWLSRPLVVWFRVAADVVDLASGEPVEGRHLIALLRTSPRNVWHDFTLSRYELGAELWGVIGALGILFLVGYSLAMATAATLILSITRSTSRLTAGARAVERGDLDHRVPVKRRDQLGDLARSFNHMTSSVQSMLEDVAEKERLAGELELAREIQESLLPARHLELGPLIVRATFQPAAEVGGDYFDVFPLSNDRLVVAIGDVAGHGLSTGLLMASLKSSVAALVHEGYAGADLIERVNRLLVEHEQSRTMVTLSVIEFDLAEDRLKVANAGHPPAFLVTAEGGADELMAGSLPLGTRLCRPVVIERPFPAGSRLFAYSDGLVEAASAAGEPFGYDRLERNITDAAALPGDALTAAILEHLADFASGTAPADDLTLLVVERTG